jgi:hypothetical protein
MIDDQQQDEPTDSLPVHSINIDRSREKSLYFLLLAVGRQRATSKEAIRMEYRTALKNLTVVKQDTKWKIEVPTNSVSFVHEIDKNNFHFYKTSLKTSTDEMQLQNLASANSFWDKFETFLDPMEHHRRKIDRFKGVFSLQPLPASVYFVSIFAIILIFPSPLGPFFAIASVGAPVFVLFPKLRGKNFLIAYLMIFLAFLMSFFTFSNSKLLVFPQLLVYLVSLTATWMYVLHLHKVYGYVENKRIQSLLFLFLVLNAQFYALKDLQQNFLILLLLSMAISVVFPIVRRKFVWSTPLIILSLFLEIFLGCILSYVLIQAFGGEIFILDPLFQLLYVVITLFWVIFLSLDGQTNMMMRIFVPVLLSTTLFSNGAGEEIQDVKVLFVNVLFLIAFLKINTLRNAG